MDMQDQMMDSTGSPMPGPGPMPPGPGPAPGPMPVLPGWMTTNVRKWLVAIVAGAAAMLVFAPYTFGLLNGVFSSVGLSTSVGGVPTTTGLLVHTLVFIVILRLTMW